MAASDEDWLYHLPAFLDTLEKAGAHDIVESVEGEVAGVLYHHRGVRIPAHDVTVLWTEEGFELEFDGVGSRAAWAVFEGDRTWDFYLSRTPGDAACLAWMCDAEYDAEEAAEYDSKQEAVGLGRFSFGVYLHPPSTWTDLEERALDTEAPCFIQRPSGRTLVPDGPLESYAEVVPPEFLGSDHPDHLGLRDAHIDAGT